MEKERTCVNCRNTIFLSQKWEWGNWSIKLHTGDSLGKTHRNVEIPSTYCCDEGGQQAEWRKNGGSKKMLPLHLQNVLTPLPKIFCHFTSKKFGTPPQKLFATLPPKIFCYPPPQKILPSQPQKFLQPIPNFFCHSTPKYFVTPNSQLYLPPYPNNFWAPPPTPTLLNYNIMSLVWPFYT